MAEKERYDVIGVEVDGEQIHDLWIKPGKEHADATSGSLMLGQVQVATTTWGWGRGYDRAYVGNWLANQEAVYVKRGLHGHALDYACKKALEQLHNDRRLNNNSSKATTQTVTVTQTAITMEVASWISGNGATAQVVIGDKVEDKHVDGITQPQALLGAIIMGLKATNSKMITILTKDAWLAQVWAKQSFKKNLNYWNKILQLTQGRQVVIKYVGGGQPITQQQPEPPKPIQPQVEEDIPPMEDWDAILDYKDDEEVLPE